MRPNRAAPRLAGRGDPSPRGCPPYAPRAGVSQPAPRGGRGSGAVGRELHLFFAGLFGGDKRPQSAGTGTGTRTGTPSGAGTGAHADTFRVLPVGALGIGRTTTSRCEHSADNTRDKKDKTDKNDKRTK